MACEILMERGSIKYLEALVSVGAVKVDGIGVKIAERLRESGIVIVLGNVVFLRPEQITKAIQSLIPLAGANSSHQRQKELEEMEKQKAAIDKEADVLVCQELWCGLGLLVVQTARCMRLTFWELSWDVMVSGATTARVFRI
ncbi:calcium uniporter protein 1, mitochondrial-like [Carya illinoinensis]|uniref:calcium uniporter protein 1, mitochondrial-like n=1 Tax=Carya illinoinensis TaxID=32201 RepID=UPI001C71CBB0|nr:calcium uniporter protein 1, mitochondrial-like [Carya illinoinensis]